MIETSSGTESPRESPRLGWRWAKAAKSTLEQDANRALTSVNPPSVPGSPRYRAHVRQSADWLDIAAAALRT